MAKRPAATLTRKNRARGMMTWYARLAYGGGRVRLVSMRTESKLEARRRMLDALDAGEFDLREPSDTTLGELVEKFIADAAARGAKEGTLATYRDRLRFLGPLHARPVAGVRAQELADALAAASEGVKPSTWNSRRAAAKMLFSYAVDSLEILDRSPARRLPARKAPKRPRDFWTPEQVDRILDAAPSPEMRLLWALMAFAGLRIHEALKAAPGDVRDGWLHVLGKGSKYARVPVSSRLKDEIARGRWDFSGLNVNKSTYALKVASRAATPFEGPPGNHRFRHSFASNLIRGGANVKAVQLLLRHATIQMTLDTYAHLLDSDLGAEVEKMLPRKKEP